MTRATQLRALATGALLLTTAGTSHAQLLGPIELEMLSVHRQRMEVDLLQKWNSGTTSRASAAQRRHMARGQRLIKSGRAHLRYSMGNPNSSRIVTQMARRIAANRSAALEITRTGSYPEVRAWLASALRKYPQTLRQDVNAHGHDPRNAADVLSACAMVSYILATGRGASNRAQDLGSRDDVRRNLLNNPYFQAHDATVRSETVQHWALLTSLLVHSVKQMPNLPAAKRERALASLRNSARIVFRSAVGRDASAFRLTNNGLTTKS